MQKIYLLEKKDYYTDEKGNNVQVAKGNTLPRVYTEKESVLRDALKAVETYKEKFGFKLSYAATYDQGDLDDYLYWAVLLDPNNEYTHEIRVYQMLTWD